MKYQNLRKMYTTCKKCSGIGSLVCDHCKEQNANNKDKDQTCPKCNNTKLQKCIHCKGSGKHYKEQLISTE